MSRNEGHSWHQNLSMWQQICLMTSTLIGVGVLTLPRTTSSKLFEAGWIAPLIGSAGAFVSLWLIVKLSKRYPGETFIEYSHKVWGSASRPWVGKVFSFPWISIYLVYLYFSTAIVSRVFGEVVVTSVLWQTPLEAMLMTMFLLVFFLCMHEVEVVARVNELLFPFIILPLLFIALASFQKAEFGNLLPINHVSIRSMAEGVYEGIYSYSGFEIMFVFFAYAQKNTNKELAGFYSLLIAALIYMLIVVAGISVFGYEELQRVTWPTLELVKTTQVPGFILERLESAFLAVWVSAVFTTVANAFYVVVYSLRQLFRKGIWFQRIMAAILLVPLFYFSLIPQNIPEVFQVASLLGLSSLFINLLIPVVYWVVILIRDMMSKREEEDVDG
ncbi:MULTISPECIES: endospore germination permease [Brevibacillus]|uniref:GerAB/ArcD/ProY family transporter n=1 Tax=Brevibacillus TaxID=55080 RepID=UPI000D10AE91|nr:MULTISPECIES: endospore germination permease [Brevibacillus]MED1945982.1 endospore germination permease [Brevibacillus formosus]MED1997827.1 endospore germination permease [Brevibacillus formosus]MED2083847.1 endospore germination permease [Brevibacillus formosus]PSK17897.1 spore gernimation protein [Brevibacillus sp. NRRL NRS-603]